MRSKICLRDAFIFFSVLLLSSCTIVSSPTPTVPGRDAPFPPTWTPTALAEATPTATLVVVPTPTWDGTPPPPSEAYVPRLRPGQLYRAMQKEEAITAVDTRNKAAYDQAHIPDAVHIPLAELQERIGELDGNNTIVFYCTSPNEAMSLEAAMDLYQVGFTQVAVLDGGLQTWYAQGYPIEGQLLTPKPGGLAPPGTITPLLTETPLSTETPLATATVPATETPVATETSPATATPVTREGE
jgi:rhodanese-related sulfurtransferase